MEGAQSVFTLQPIQSTTLGYKTANPAILLNALLAVIEFLSNALFAVIDPTLSLYLLAVIDRLPALLVN